MPAVYRKVTEFKTVEGFAAGLAAEKIDIGLAPAVPAED